MKQQDKIKLQQLSVPELKTELTKLEKQLVELRMKKELTQLKNVRQPKTIRHDIARLQSIIHTKELIQLVDNPAETGSKS